MNNARVAEELSDSVKFMKNVFGIECTLSEILSMRRYVVDALKSNDETTKDNLEAKINPKLEAIARLFWDYYSIDFYELWPKREDGKPILFVAGFSRLVTGKSPNEFDFEKPKPAEYFKEYLRRIQEKSYFP